MKFALLALCISIPLPFIGVYCLFVRSTKRDANISKALVERAERYSETIESLVLRDAEPIFLVVKFRDELAQDVPGVTGVAAVRLFDKLRLAAPHAEAISPLPELATIVT